MHALDIHLNTRFLMDYLSFEEVMVMRCVDKTRKAFLDVELHSLYTQIEPSVRSHQRYQHIFNSEESELKKISDFMHFSLRFGEISPASIHLNMEGFNRAAVKLVADEKRGREIIDATLARNQALATELIAQGSISEYFRSNATYHAALLGQEATVRSLLASGSIYIGYRSHAFVWAFRRGYIQVAFDLWSSGPISTCSKIQGILLALRRGRFRALGGLVARAFGS